MLFIKIASSNVSQININDFSHSEVFLFLFIFVPIILTNQNKLDALYHKISWHFGNNVYNLLIVILLKPGMRGVFHATRPNTLSWKSRIMTKREKLT